jgi:hypothetical protein
MSKPSLSSFLLTTSDRKSCVGHIVRGVNGHVVSPSASVPASDGRFKTGQGWLVA